MTFGKLFHGFSMAVFIIQCSSIHINLCAVCRVVTGEKVGLIGKTLHYLVWASFIQSESHVLWLYNTEIEP